MTNLFVNEVFWSLQGEGSMAGRASVFIRLQGCPNNCSFCDTRYAIPPASSQNICAKHDVLHKTQPANTCCAMATQELIEYIAARSKQGILAVITGGEPCCQDILPLTHGLLQAGFDCQIETSGSAKILCAPNTFVTLSPKKCGVLEANWALANEIKLPVASLDDILRYSQRLEQITDRWIWLQPVSCARQATELCISVCQEKNWRLSIQMHKYLGIQ